LIAGVGLSLLAFTVSQGVLLWPAVHAAVAIVHDVPVLESPVPMAEPMFALPEAQIVTVSAEHDHFMLVKTSDGRIGWVADTNVVPVVPTRSNSPSDVAK
jgi:hypothetical protein